VYAISYIGMQGGIVTGKILRLVRKAFSSFSRTVYLAE
jgi:hypothetical protein